MLRAFCACLDDSYNAPDERDFLERLDPADFFFWELLENEWCYLYGVLPLHEPFDLQT